MKTMGAAGESSSNFRLLVVIGAIPLLSDISSPLGPFPLVESADLRAAAFKRLARNRDVAAYKFLRACSWLRTNKPYGKLLAVLGTCEVTIERLVRDQRCAV